MHIRVVLTTWIKRKKIQEDWKKKDLIIYLISNQKNKESIAYTYLHVTVQHNLGADKVQQDLIISHKESKFRRKKNLS